MSVYIQLIFIGGGGHAGVVFDLVDELNRQNSSIYRFEMVGYYDDNDSSSHLTIPYLGTIQQCRINAQTAKDKNIYFICCIGDNAVRKRIIESISVELQWVTLVHPKAIVSHSATLSHGTVVCAGAFIGTHSRIGSHSIINTHASIDHDCLIGNYVHIAPGVNLCGNVIVQDLTLIGVGTSVIPKIQIGQRVVIGAGSTVLGDVVDDTTAVGIIKKEKKEFSNRSETKKMCWICQKSPDLFRIRSLLLPSIMTNHFTNFGPCVSALETALRAILMIDDSKSIIMTNSGTSALHAVAGALRISSNNSSFSFATQAYTFPSSAQGNLMGSVIVDVDEGGGLALEKVPSDVNGVIVTNVFGHIVDIRKYVEWAAKNKKFLVFDNAATSFTLYQGKNSVNFGTAAILSFHHTKPIGFGEGGAIIIDHQFESAVRQCINFGYNVPRGDVQWHSLGSNFKMSDVQAAFILSYLDQFERILTTHQRLYRQLEENLHELNPQVKMMPNYSSSIPFTSCFPILFSFHVSEELVKWIASTELIDVRKYYKPLIGEMNIAPQAYEFYSHIVCFPCQSNMTDMDLKRIMDIVRKVNSRSYSLILK